MSVYSSLGPLPAAARVRAAAQSGVRTSPVAQPAGVLRGALYRQARVGRQALLRRARLPAARLRRHQPREREHVQAPREQHPRAKALRLRRHAEQQMLRADVAVPKRGRCVPRRGYRARGAFCEPCAVFHAFSLPPVPL